MKKYINEIYLYSSLIILELFFQVIIFNSIKIDFVYPLLFNISLTFFIIFSCSLFKNKICKIVYGVWLLLICILFGVEIIYYDVFDAFVSIYSLINGTGDVLQFTDLIRSAIFSNLHVIAFCLLPIIGYLIFNKHFSFNYSFKNKCLSIIFSLCFYIISFLSLLLPHEGFVPTLNIYLNNQPTTTMMQRLGCLTSFRNQIREQFFIYEDNRNIKISLPLPKDEENYDYQIMDIDFNKLIDNENNSSIKKMHEYFSSIKPTNKNEYTGMFKDYNLIMITAEAFSDYAIDEKLTPTLYKMYNEGFRFNNFYNPLFYVSTTDGEYVTNIGLYPKDGIWSFSESSDNYLPFTMGKQFQKLGIKTYAYHNHTYTYYNRHLSHTNIWKNYKGLGNGLNVKSTWPESDLEMIQLTSNEYMKNERFHAYFMTVSGHKNYDWEGNTMSTKNKKYVDHLNLSEFSKGYLACNIEFDRAMEQLLKDLEKYGHLDDTLIVIAPDHYPYGLNKEQIEELSGRDIKDDFDLYKSAWLIYSPSMSQPIDVDTYCSSVDILPTVSNLLGLEYDSRLLAGVDVFSDATPIIALQDHSFMTNNVKYNAKTENVTFHGNRLSDKTVQSLYNSVINRFKMSEKILDEDYYRIVFGK